MKEKIHGKMIRRSRARYLCVTYSRHDIKMKEEKKRRKLFEWKPVTSASSLAKRVWRH